MAYGRAARRLAWAANLAVGWPPLLARPTARTGHGVAPRWDLPLRMALTATLVVSLTRAAGRVGRSRGRVLAALPVLASILTAFTRAARRRPGDDPASRHARRHGRLRGLLRARRGARRAGGHRDAFMTAAGAALVIQAATARVGATSAQYDG